MANEKRIRWAIAPVATLTAEYDPLGTQQLVAAEFSDWPQITSTAHMPIWLNRDRESFSGGPIEPFLVYGTAHTLGSTTITIGEAPENVIDRFVCHAGCKAHHGLTRRDFMKEDDEEYTTANQTLNSTTWANMPGWTTTKDLTVECYVGDRVELWITARWNTEANFGFLDMISDPAGTPFSWGSSGTPNNAHGGIAAWIGHQDEGGGISGGPTRTITSAEIVSGILTLRMRYRTNTATNKILIAGTGDATRWGVKNWGPQDEKPVLPTFS